MALSNKYVKAGTITPIFTATGEVAVTNMFFCNNSATVDTELDIYFTPIAKSAGTATIVIKSLSLPATETFVFDAEKLILANGDEIGAKATVDSIVVATVSSVQTG
jgi:hypothetical protein